MIQLISLLVSMSVALYIMLYIETHRNNKKHLKEYGDVAPESSVYKPKQKKNKRVA